VLMELQEPTHSDTASTPRRPPRPGPGPGPGPGQSRCHRAEAPDDCKRPHGRPCSSSQRQHWGPALCEGTSRVIREIRRVSLTADTYRTTVTSNVTVP